MSSGKETSSPEAGGRQEQYKSIGSSENSGFVVLFHPVKPNPKYRRILGNAIRVYRKEAGLSQEKLAEKAELHPVYVSTVERGAKTISMDSLMRIARALKVRVRDLVADI